MSISIALASTTETITKVDSRIDEPAAAPEFRTKRMHLVLIRLPVQMAMLTRDRAEATVRRRGVTKGFELIVREPMDESEDGDGR